MRTAIRALRAFRAGVRMSRVGARISRMGVCISRVGACALPLGSRAHPRGLSTHPLGVRSYPLGLRASPLGFLAHPVGLFVHPVGNRAYPVGNRRSPRIVRAPIVFLRAHPQQLTPLGRSLRARCPSSGSASRQRSTAQSRRRRPSDSGRTRATLQPVGHIPAPKSWRLWKPPTATARSPARLAPPRPAVADRDGSPNRP